MFLFNTVILAFSEAPLPPGVVGQNVQRERVRIAVADFLHVVTVHRPLDRNAAHVDALQVG
jgi:hypothetical protein